MNKKPLNISEEAAVQMPMKTVASLITLVAIGTWAFFGVQETLNQHSTKIELMQKDLEDAQEKIKKLEEKNDKENIRKDKKSLG